MQKKGKLPNEDIFFKTLPSLWAMSPPMRVPWRHQRERKEAASWVDLNTYPGNGHEHKLNTHTMFLFINTKQGSIYTRVSAPMPPPCTHQSSRFKSMAAARTQGQQKKRHTQYLQTFCMQHSAHPLFSLTWCTCAFAAPKGCPPSSELSSEDISQALESKSLCQEHLSFT